MKYKIRRFLRLIRVMFFMHPNTYDERTAFTRECREILVKIPYEQFDTFTMGGISAEKHCSVGHLLKAWNIDTSIFAHGQDHTKWNDLKNFGRAFLEKYVGTYETIYHVNDIYIDNARYNQKEPKYRFIAFLDDMIKLGY